MNETIIMPDENAILNSMIKGVLFGLCIFANDYRKDERTPDLRTAQYMVNVTSVREGKIDILPFEDKHGFADSPECRTIFIGYFDDLESAKTFLNAAKTYCEILSHLPGAKLRINDDCNDSQFEISFRYFDSKLAGECKERVNPCNSSFEREIVCVLGHVVKVK